MTKTGQKHRKSPEITGFSNDFGAFLLAEKEGLEPSVYVSKTLDFIGFFKNSLAFH